MLRRGLTRAIASLSLRFLDHTQLRTTVGMTPLDEWSARRRDLYLTTHNTQNKHPCPGGIRTNNLNRWAAADTPLSPSCHWDRRIPALARWKYKTSLKNKIYYWQRVLILYTIRHRWAQNMQKGVMSPKKIFRRLPTQQSCIKNRQNATHHQSC
jgi:hypothetical protein